MLTRFRHCGVRTFGVLWMGALISIIGSGMTSFALSVWVYRRTGSTGQLGLVILAAAVPTIAISPLAGVLVDRWDRRWTMALSAVGASVCTLFIGMAFLSGAAKIWPVYLGVAGISFFGAFHWPAFTAASSLLVPAEHLARASGLSQFAQAAAMILSPPLSVALVAVIRIEGVIVIDFLTYLFAVAMILSVSGASLSARLSNKVSKSLLREAILGWAYVNRRQGLVQLLLLFTAIGFTLDMTQVLVVPLVMKVAPARVLATVVAVCSSGMVVGSVTMAIWGGPKRRVRGVIWSGIVLGVALLVAGLQTNWIPLAAGLFVFAFAVPIAMGCDQAIWQAKTEPELQGRVFALRNMAGQLCLPAACLVAGPLVDRVFDPSLAVGGSLARSVGMVTGVGPGRGVGLLMMVLGLLTIFITFTCYSSPRLRMLEDELPDVSHLEPFAHVTASTAEPLGYAVPVKSTT